MPKLPILFFEEDIKFTLKDKNHIRQWIYETIVKEKKCLENLNFIFCSDAYLLDINIQYLKHHTFTDIITFDNSEKKNTISGDIFISIERIKENAKAYKTTFVNELHRVIIHGTLHLLDYTDKTKEAKILMTQKENEYLALRKF